MDINNVVQIVLNNGIGVGCVIYFMLVNYKFMQKLTELLAEIQATLHSIQDGQGKK